MQYRPFCVLAGAVIMVVALSCHKHVVEDSNYEPLTAAHVSGTVRDGSAPVSGVGIHVIYEPDQIPASAMDYRRRDHRIVTRICREGHGDSPANCAYTIAAEFVPMDRAVRINWTVYFAQNLSYFEVRRDDATVAVFEAANIPAGHMYTYVDRSLTNGTTYFYSLFVQCGDGTNGNVFSMPVEPTAEGFYLEDYALYQNYPNPVENATSIPFDLTATAWVTLKVYNSAWQEVNTLVDSSLLPLGSLEAPLAMDSLPNGFYGYEITAGDAISARRWLLKNTQDYITLRSTPAAATTDANGRFDLSIEVGDSIEIYDDDGFWVATGILNNAKIVALKSGYAAADTTLVLSTESPHTVDVFLTAGN